MTNLHLSPKVQTIQTMYVQRNNEARSRKACFREKAVSIKYSVCVSVGLVTQLAKRGSPSELSSVACTVPFFPITSLKARFSEQCYEHKTCVLIFSTMFV